MTSAEPWSPTPGAPPLSPRSTAARCLRSSSSSFRVPVPAPRRRQPSMRLAPTWRVSRTRTRTRTCQLRTTAAKHALPPLETPRESVHLRSSPCHRVAQHLAARHCTRPRARQGRSGCSSPAPRALGGREGAHNMERNASVVCGAHVGLCAVQRLLAPRPIREYLLSPFSSGAKPIRLANCKMIRVADALIRR